MQIIGRVRSIVNYDKTYGIFLRGFANICAVSNSVIYDRALLWWSTGTLVELTDASVADNDRNGNRLMPFRFFFFFLRPPSLLLRLFLSMKEIKNKLSTDSPCFGPLSVGWSKEIIRELVKIIHISEDDHENFGEERVAGRASLASSSLWWNGRRRRTIEACSTCPEWVQGENRKNTVATQKR